MLRKIVCGFIVLALVAGAGVAGQKAKKARPITGKIKKVDAAAGTLTVTVKKKQQVTDQDFTVDDATKVVVFTGKDKQVLTGKDGLKDAAFKEGARVVVVADADGKVTEVRGGDLPKGRNANVVRGAIRKVDPATGTLTLAVKNKKQTAERDFQVTDTTKVIIFNGADKQEATGKDGLKNDQIKEGVVAAIATNPQGKVTEIRVGMPPKKNK